MCGLEKCEREATAVAEAQQAATPWSPQKCHGDRIKCKSRQVNDAQADEAEC
jgi:hypothetical protein